MEDPIVQFLKCTGLVAAMAAAHVFVARHLSSFIGKRGADMLRDPKSVDDMALDITSSILSLYMFICYSLSVFKLWEGLQSRIYGQSLLATHSFLVHFAYTIYEMLIFERHGGWKSQPLLMGHHVITLSLLGLVLVSGFGAFYGSLVGTVEGTNPCLSCLYTLRRLEMKDSRWVPIVGVALVFGFGTLRVIGLGVAVYLIVTDCNCIEESDLGLASRLRWGVSAVAVLWVLSIYWFALLCRGLNKIIKKRTSECFETEVKIAEDIKISSSGLRLNLQPLVEKAE